MEQMKAQAEHVGTRMISDHVSAVDLSRRPFVITCDSGETHTCDTLVIATGAKAKWLGIPSEDKFKGYGVSACATCDGFFYRGKDVIVVGGGNSAVEEALYLSNLAKKVTVVHRRDGFRAEKILQERLFAKPNVEIVWNHVLDEVMGGENPPGVTSARLKHADTGATREIAVDGVFVAIGHAPASELFKGQIEITLQRLHQDRAELDGDQHSRRVRRRRCRRRRLSPGGHGGGPRLHGRARSRALPRRQRDRKGGRRSQMVSG